MRPLPSYAFALSTVVSICVTACDNEDKSVDTADTDTSDTEDPVDTGDTGDTEDTEDTSEETGDTNDTNDTDTGDSDDTADTAVVDTGDTGIIDTGETTGPGPNAVPDFLLADINPNSSTMGQNISPRDYLQQISGWYFIKST